MGALDNYRVIDLGQYVAGPLTGMLLADQGAEVIRIDPPGGPVFDTAANATWNRGKKSICLDLKSTKDVETARKLIATADVVIENFRPGVMQRLGLDPERLRDTCPGLVTVSLPGFSPADPRSDMQGWEGIIMAATDVFRPLAEYRDMIQMLHRKPAERDGVPAFTAEPVASVYAALIASLCTTTALYQRMTTGRGQHVEVPLFDAMLQAVGILAMSRLPFVPVTMPVFSGFDHQYRCADGQWVHIVATVPRHGERFLKAIGREDLIEKGLTMRGLASKPELNNLLIHTLTEVFATRPALEWEDLFVKHDIPGARCLSMEDWLQHPQATDSDLLVRVEDPLLGPVRQPGLQVKLYGTPGEIRNPAPVPDQDRAGILALADAGVATITPDPVSRADSPSRTAEAPLEGIRVLDLCIILAGPTCGRTLAELGADVIKIDDPNRGEVLYHHDINRGKRSLLLDLKTPAGMEIFWELVETADVIVQNYRTGVVESLGIDYESVRARKPDIVYASLNAFGDCGPWKAQPGYEEVAQALTGMQVRFGGREKPILWPYGVVNDYGTGYAGAFGVMMALLVRRRTGEGQHVTSALARTACTLQSAWLLDYEGRVRDEPTGPDCKGSGPLQRLYACRDGWIYVGAGSSGRVAEIIGAPDDDSLEAALEIWCLARNSDDAVKELLSSDSAAHRLVWINELASDPLLESRGLIVVRDHERVGTLRTTGPGQWFSDALVSAGRPAPLAGGDAESILAELPASHDPLQLAEAGALRLPARE